MKKPNIAHKMSVGEPFIPERAWLNSLIQAGQDAKRGDAGTPEHFADRFSPVDVLIRNDSSPPVDFDQWDVAGLGSAIIDPAVDRAEYLRIPSFQGVVPVAGTHEGYWAICLEPIKAGKCGLARAAGVVPATITAGSSDPTKAFVEIVNGQKTLGYADSGTGTVLDSQTSGTTRLSYIRIGSNGSGGGGGGATITQAFIYVEIPSQNVTSGAMVYLNNFTIKIAWPSSALLGTSNSGLGQTGIYANAPNGTNYLAILPSLLGVDDTLISPPVGGAWLKWDSNTSGERTVELVWGPYPFSGAPSFAPGVTQSANGNDRQCVTTGPSGDKAQCGFFVAATQNSGGTRTISGYAWIVAYAVTPGGGGGSSSNVQAKMLSADVTNATNTFADLSDLSVTVVAGDKYRGRIDLWCENSTAAEGIKFDLNGGTASMTDFRSAAGVFATGSASYTQGTTLGAAVSDVLNWSLLTGGVNIIIIFEFTVNGGGTFIPRYAENSAHTSGTVTVRKGSNLEITKVG